jgi:hypothetical protein
MGDEWWGGNGFGMVPETAVGGRFSQSYPVAALPAT